MRFTLMSVSPSPTPAAPSATPTPTIPTATPLPGTHFVYLPVIISRYQSSLCLSHEIEPNNASANEFQHLPLCQSLPLAGTLPSDDPGDYYRIVITTDSRVTIELYDISPGSDFDLYLYDADLIQLDVSSLNGNAPEQIGPRLLASGLYYLRVYPDPTETGGNRTYVLRWKR